MRKSNIYSVALFSVNSVERPPNGNFRRIHSRPQRPRSFLSAPRIGTSGRNQFVEHGTRSIFSANQICQI